MNAECFVVEPVTDCKGGDFSSDADDTALKFQLTEVIEIGVYGVLLGNKGVI